MIRPRRSITAARLCGAGALVGLVRLLWGCNEAPLVGDGAALTGSVHVCVEQLATGTGGTGGGSTGDGCAANPQGVADGQSVIPILVTTSPPGGDAGLGGASPVSLHLFVSNGTWLVPEGTTSPGGSSLDVQVVDGSPLSVAFKAGTSLLPTWVYVTRGDASYALSVSMLPAAIEGIQVTASPLFLSATSNNSTVLTAQVLAANGALPSDGTLVKFAVNSAIAGVQIFPMTSAIDGNGRATATLVLVPGSAPYTPPTSIPVTVTATTPGKQGTTVSAPMFSIPVAP